MEAEGTDEDLELLMASRAAWEALVDEMETHHGDQRTYLCLACYRLAQAFVDAVAALSKRLTEDGIPYRRGPSAESRATWISASVMNLFRYPVWSWR